MGTIYKRKDGYYYYQYQKLTLSGYKKTVGISLGKDIDKKQLPKLKERFDQKYDPKFINPFKKSRITLTQSMNDYIEHRIKLVSRFTLSPNTLHSDKISLNLFRKYCERNYGLLYVDEITKKYINKYKLEREEQVSDTTIGNNLRHLSSYFTYLVENDFIEHNPVKEVKIPKSRKRDDDDIMSEEEWRKFKDYLNDYIDNWLSNKIDYDFFKVMIFLQMNLGMRIGEVSSIKWKKDKVDVGKGTSHSYVYLSDKNSILTINFKRNWRQIEMNESIQKILNKIPKKTKVGRKVRKSTHKTIEHKFVFENPHTQRTYLLNSISRFFTKLLLEVGVNEKYTTHSLRHGFCVECIRKGVDIFKLSKFVGHKVVHMTEMYSNHLSVSDFSEISNKIIEIK